MTEILRTTKINETWLRLDAEVYLLEELNDAFKFRPNNFQFSPLYKNKVWDGWIRLVQVYKQKTYVGLANQLKDFCDSRGYIYEGYLPSQSNVSMEDVQSFVKKLNIHSANKPIQFRDYQYDAVYTALKYKKHIIQSPTGSGKSAQIYTIIRALEGKNILLLVPTVSLVTQMFSDFQDYSSANGWDVKDNCHVIYAGQSKVSDKLIKISTWQSLQSKTNIKDSWFEQFDVVIVDETHLAKGKEISGILEKCTNAKYRLGFTGSLDKFHTHKQILFSHFTNTTKVASTRELIDKGHLSNIKIKALVLKYDTEICEALYKAKYQAEISFLVGNDKRNKMIKKLALSTKGNTLVLFRLVEKHGEILYDLMKSSTDKQVYFIHGGTEVEDREQIRNLIKSNDNVIIIASEGVFSTGVNAPNIHNIIFTSPTKSMIKVIQSIGRGLRKAEGKNNMKLFDIADDLRVKKHENYTWIHFAERLSIYASEQFEYEIVEVTL